MNETALRTLNTKAIALFRAGHYRAAGSLLTEALHRMRSSLQEDSRQGGAILDAPSSLSDNVELSPNNICVEVGGRSTSNANTSKTGSDDEPFSGHEGPSFFLFDRAFAMPVRSCDSRTSCVILYNLALSHTLAWCESRNSADYQSAIKLFQMALAVVESLLDERGVPSDDFSFLQLLAIFNNLGYLHWKGPGHHQKFEASAQPHDQGLAEATGHCISAIEALLVSLDSSGTEHHEEYRFFRWSSLFLFNRKDLSMAPAA